MLKSGHIIFTVHINIYLFDDIASLSIENINVIRGRIYQNVFFRFEKGCTFIFWVGCQKVIRGLNLVFLKWSLSLIRCFLLLKRKILWWRKFSNWIHFTDGPSEVSISSVIIFEHLTEAPLDPGLPLLLLWSQLPPECLDLLLQLSIISLDHIQLSL